VNIERAARACAAGRWPDNNNIRRPVAGKGGQLKGPDKTCHDAAEAGIQILCRRLSNRDILFEADQKGLAFLGHLFLAQSALALDCKFHLDPQGPGLALFSSSSDTAFWIHRYPCAHGRLRLQNGTSRLEPDKRPRRRPSRAIEGSKSKGFPYSQFEDTPVWRSVAKAIAGLEANRDLELTTARSYVIGAVCKAIIGAGLVSAPGARASLQRSKQRLQPTPSRKAGKRTARRRG